MASFNFRPHHAEVFFSGELTVESASDLIGTVDLMIDAYHYRRVVLSIDSNGGLVEALARVLMAQGRWRDADVRLCTRAAVRAQSAAALILSFGDDRVAGAGAELLYHRVVSPTPGPLNARGAGVLQEDLTFFDERAVQSLVDRALDGAPEHAPLIVRAEPSDAAVLRQLAERLAPAPAGARRRSMRRLARLVGRAVRRALRARDRKSIAELYRHLFSLEIPISGSLACTLRLVDRVDGVDPDPAAAPAGSLGLTVPEWRSLYPPRGEISRETLVRHTLALGQTGSGKSQSVILPVVRALAQAPPERVGASLVIDPRHEIGPLLERWAPDRLQRLIPADVGLNLMSSPRWSLDADVAAGRWLSAAHKILLRTVAFVPTSPARVLTDHAPETLNGEFFAREGTEFLLTVVAFVLMVIHCDVPRPEKWLSGDNLARTWIRSLRERANGSDEMRGPNALALASYALTGPLVAPPPAPAPTVFDDPLPPWRWLFAQIAEAAQRVWREGEGRGVLDRVLHYWEPMVHVKGQYAGVLSSARATCAELAAPGVATTVYFGCEPGARAGTGPFDFARAVAVPGDGRILLYQPSRDALDSVVVRALKAVFFEAVFNDPDRVGGAPDVPLIAYVCDEAHRFVTSDWTHGEATFLDACRAYGVACVLASQSMASIEHAFAHGGGTEAQHRSAASTLWTNTATKMVFRTSDPRTASRLEDLCPYRPGLAPIIQVRPPSTLASGECYAALPDGRFERRKLMSVFRDGLGLVPSLRPVALATRYSPDMSDD